jgi:hypothetical protein
MSLTLRDEDRRALDLLLDRGPAARNGNGAAGNGNGGHGNGGGHVFAAADAVSPQRIDRAQRLLRMLDLLPQPEPAADLAARTLGRLEQTSAPVEVRHPLMTDGQRAHA